MDERLLDADVRGTLEYGRSLAPMSWLRVGGEAEMFFQPADEDDLAQFMGLLPADIRAMPVGVCSNLLIRDGGVEGVVIRLGRAFGKVNIEGDRVRAGAAALGQHVARKAARAGIDISFLRTIPGTIGGAVKMNAGCYGRYLADAFVSAHVLARDGTRHRLGAGDMDFGYRTSGLPDDWIVLEAELTGPNRDPGAIESEMDRLLARRSETQPTRERTCGSVFRNPAGYSSTGDDDDDHDMKAWKLIETAGMRGARVGGAQISERHANFMVNTGSASAAELEALGENVRKRVFQKHGVWLEWEIRRIGNPRREEKENAGQ